MMLKTLKTYCTYINVFLIVMFNFPPNLFGQVKSTFSDSAAFHIYVNQEKIGTNNVVLDNSGRYETDFTLSMAGQTLNFKKSTYSIYAIPAIFEVTNPVSGNIRIELNKDSVRYSFNGKEVFDVLPESYILYDDYGSLFESLMFKKYDMDIRGKQVFQRYRLAEEPTLQNSRLKVTIEYLGDEELTAKGQKYLLHKYDWEIFGLHATYWIDDDFKLYKAYSSYDNSLSIRGGFENFLDFNPQKKHFVKASIEIPTRDGIELSTDIYFPDSEEKEFPIVLIRTPYKKEMQEMKGNYWSKKGYICVIQDVRGRFESEGEWEPFVNEGLDGYDTIEWLAKQSWSNGKIGMIGASYSGWAQFLAAIEKPPHLVTIIPSVTPPDPFYNMPYENGSFFTLANLWWAQVIESEATSELSGKTIMEITNKDYKELVDALPVIDLDKKFFGGKNTYWRKWIEHNTLDEYWKRASYLEKLKDVDIPVFIQSGWFDTNGMGSKLSYQKLKEFGKENIKIILGPWAHTDKATSMVSGNFVGEEAVIDLEELFSGWFDYWLKAENNGIMDESLVQIYLINSRKWLYDETYPLTNTEYKKLYLGSNESAVSLNGDGFLEMKHIDSLADFDEFIYDPGDPTPSQPQRYKDGGRQGYINVTSHRNDILVYDSPELQDDMTIAGPISAEIYASSSAVDTDWFVILEALPPSGGTIPLGKGVIRARFRNSLSAPELLEKDKIYKYSIDLWQMGITLKKGYKLRVEISSSFFPEFSRNLNTGGHNEMETTFVKATQRIYHNKKYPSNILIPIVNISKK